MRVPLVASWHTNLYEFAASRLDNFLRLLPDSPRSHIVRWWKRRCSPDASAFTDSPRLYSRQIRHSLTCWSAALDGPVSWMRRGPDTSLFSPLRRVRSDREFVIGYVGRLSPEKNVRLFSQLEKALTEAGCRDYRFLIVGEGAERAWLRSALQRSELLGILREEELARAYASMDVFVFPSSTDTFGKVVLEAMASEVPAIVTSEGGPKFLVTPGQNGEIVNNLADFAEEILKLRNNPELLIRMRGQARSTAGLSRCAQRLGSVLLAEHTSSQELRCPADSNIATDPSSRSRLTIHAKIRVSRWPAV